MSVYSLLLLAIAVFFILSGAADIQKNKFPTKFHPLIVSGITLLTIVVFLLDAENAKLILASAAASRF